MIFALDPNGGYPQSDLCAKINECVRALNAMEQPANGSVASEQDQRQQAKAAIALFTNDQSWIRIKYLGRVGLNGLLKWLEEKSQQQP